jgi:hypothetical protein
MTSTVIWSVQNRENICFFGFGWFQNPKKNPNFGQINNISQNWDFGVVPKVFLIEQVLLAVYGI